MPATAVSSLALAAQKLRRMVSLSATFQSATGTLTDTDAAAFVLEKLAGAQTVRPYAVVSFDEHYGHKLIAGGVQNQLRPFGSLLLYLTRDTDVNYYDDAISAGNTAMNFFGGVLDDVVALAAADDPGSADGTSHLAVTNTEMIDFNETAPETWNSLGRWFYGVFRVDWGDG